MVGSSALPKNRYHVRSISLPARSHPIALKIEEDLNKLRTLETSSSSAETVQHGLLGLVSLYNNVEDLIHSPVTQQALVLNQHENLVEEVLDESVKLLDVCNTTRDFLLMMKEGVNVLQSAIRRRSSIGDSTMEMKLVAYMTLRKKVKKNMNKSISELKKMNSKYVSCSSPLLDLDQHLSVVVRVLKEVFSITISIFRSLLMFMSVSTSSKMKLSKWSLVSKMLQNKGEGETEDSNEVVRVDSAISSLLENIQCQNNGMVKLVQERLKDLEMRFEEAENGVGCMYKRLIQTRVSLLNIFTQ